MDIETSHIFVCPNCHERLSVTPEYREAIRWLWLVGFAVLLVIAMSTGGPDVSAAGWLFASITILFLATLLLEFIFPPRLARDSDWRSDRKHSGIARYNMVLTEAIFELLAEKGILTGIEVKEGKN